MKSMKRVSTLAVCALSAMALVGCAGGGGGPSDAELIASMINDQTSALLAQDIEKTTMDYADDFTWDQGGKAEYVDFLNTAKDGGFLEDMTVNMDDLDVVVDGMSATAGPVVASGLFGDLTLNFDLEKRDGKWVVVGQTQEM